MRSNNILLIIGGPTAVGKSEVACCVAEKVEGEIISADSMAVYKKMDIGTAKFRECISKIKHHLVDMVEPDDYFDVKIFERLALKAYSEILSRNKVPMLVGGTYLYIQAFLYGISETPDPDWNLRRRLYSVADRKGSEYLYGKLKAIDPEYAMKVHPKDTRRIVRALEVFINSGKPFSHFHKWEKPRFSYKGFYLKRNWTDLRKRIEHRIRNMLKDGLLEEIKILLEGGLSLVPLQAIGYKEFIPVIRGEYDVEKGFMEAVKNTCYQAKRQIRWFRRQGWYEIDLDKMNIKEACDRIVRIYAET